MHTFQTPNPVNLRVELGEGKVTVTAADTATSTVELISDGSSAGDELISRSRVEQRGDDIVVDVPKARAGLFRRGSGIDVIVHVPTGSNAKLETTSADIETRGELGRIKAASGSGEVNVEHGSDVTVRTGSGDVTVRTATGNVDSKSGSAEVVMGSIGGDADIISGSGDVIIDSVDGVLKVKCGSGDVVLKSGGDGVDAMAGSGDLLLRRVDHGRVKAKTGSGDIAIGVADGTAAYLDIMTVTGDVKSDLDGSEAPSDGELTVEILVQTGSGDVVLQRS